MSYSISSSRKVLAFNHHDGKIYYTLVEKTADSSLHPRTFHWSVVYFGEYDGAIKTIFSLAANCEGGMTKTPSGDILPEKYIRSWMLAMNKPLLATNISGEINSSEFKKDTIFPDDSDSENQFKQDWESLLSFLKNNYDHMYDKLTENGESTSVNNRLSYNYDLTQHPEILIFMKSLKSMEKKGFWRFMQIYDRDVTEAWHEPVLTRNMPSSDITLVVPYVLKLKDDENLLISNDGINYHCEGWKYQVIGKFVESLWKINGKYVKNYHELIEGYRNAIDSAKVAHSLEITIDLSLIDEKTWYGKKVHTLVENDGSKHIYNEHETGIVKEYLRQLLSCKDGITFTVV
jgi:hypothetical protein